MNNNSKRLLVAMLLSSSPAFAQTAFQGFYGQVGTGYEVNTVKSGTSDDNIGLTYRNAAEHSGSAPLVVAVGYNFNVADQFLLGVGIDYSLLKTTSGLVTAQSSDPNILPNTTHTKVSGRYNAYLMPGYVIDANRLAYLKLGYSSQHVEDFSTPNVASLGSANVSGYVLGLGYKQMISGSVYAFGEGNYMNYSRGTLLYTDANFRYYTHRGTQAYNLLVGLGYQF